MSKPYSFAVITVSDTASVDNSLDKSGPLLIELLTTFQPKAFVLLEHHVIPDEPEAIRPLVNNFVSKVDLLLLTGGTGFADRDQTPDTVGPMLTRPTPGITQLLMSASLQKTPMAALSRMVSGFIDHMLVITLPGSPKACRENMDALMPVLPHAIDLVRNQRNKIQQTHAALASSSAQSIPGGHQCVHHHHHHHKERGTPATNDLGAPVTRRARHSPFPMISVSEAQAIIAQHATPQPIKEMPLSKELVGYVLADDVYANEPVPGYRASIVDGYAVIADDGPGTYPVTQVSVASAAQAPTKLHPGQIARVATGGLVPEGATAVVMVEDTQLVSTTADGNEEATVEILVAASAGSNIRPIGSDCAQGALVCARGTVISPLGSELGVLASVGVTSVKVHGKPRVGVLSSGNEVRDVGDNQNPLVPGEIRDSNRMTLLAAIEQAGFEAVDLGIVRDKVDALETAFREAADNVDVIISTGGVSMGEADWIKPVLQQRLGATLHFGRVHMKPGKPTTFATIPIKTAKNGPLLAFALPGNPVSATVTFYLFVLPALRRMSCITRPENVVLKVKTEHDVTLDSRPEYHRVQVSVTANGLSAVSTGNQQSSRMISMTRANGFLVLPPSTPERSVIHQGEWVDCMLVGSLV
ncbi:hypothetical protein BC940DRAFT_295344 [Gongronella butleri]|nr:hypothetical protein BC940DRAFT_295344 [Gongronella butleri]